MENTYSYTELYRKPNIALEETQGDSEGEKLPLL